jgi:phospholipase/carboxylesterase
MSALPDIGFIHNYIPATDRSRTPLLLLHGVGGDENALLPFGEKLATGAAILSPRGKQREKGAALFFRRLSETEFDQKDLAFRTRELAHFIDRARKLYGLAKPIAFGFSNGANIAASMLFTMPDILAGAVLLRGTLPFEPQSLPDLNGFPIAMLSGETDTIVEPYKRDRLAEIFRKAGADLTYQVFPCGHDLSPRDIETLKKWHSAHR